MRFYLLDHPFPRPIFLQITTGTTRTDTALPDTTTEGTATVVIETETEIVMTDVTGTGDTTGTVIGGTTKGVLGDMKGGGTEENAKRDLA